MNAHNDTAANKNAPRCSGCGMPHPETDSDWYTRCCGKALAHRTKNWDGSYDRFDAEYNEIAARWGDEY